MPAEHPLPQNDKDPQKLYFVGRLSLILPKVRRPYLFGLAGIFWTVAGTILCARGTVWLQALPPVIGAALFIGSGILAAAGYLYGFSKIVQRNLSRIRSMPERASVFAFTAVRGYLMIGMMMTIGIALRNSSLPKYYLIVPYYAMGGVLLVGSIQFFRAFIAAISLNELGDERP